MISSFSGSETHRARPLRVAVFGVLMDGAGSSAGVYPLLLAELLARGHRVEFFGNQGYVRPRSLESMAGYRFHPLHIEVMERLWSSVQRFEWARALVAQLNNSAYHMAAIRAIERAHARDPFDVVLSTDQQPHGYSKLPLIAWPQGPPQTEAAALRTSPLAGELVRASGLPRFLAVQAFYAYRVATARIALNGPDFYLCGSEWARRAWIRFGADPSRVRAFPYPIDVQAFAAVPPLERKDAVTFLWLGRATPRKRLDLFLEGFELLRRRRPNARARIVGDVTLEPFSRRALERHATMPGLTVEAPLGRAAVTQLFAEIDVLVQPSTSENFGFSVAEALAAGRAVVGGPTNGTLEYAADAGFVFHEYSAEGVAGAMERAWLAVAGEGPELSRRARQAARVFEMDAVADRFCSVCEEVIARKRPGWPRAAAFE